MTELETRITAALADRVADVRTEPGDREALRAAIGRRRRTGRVVGVTGLAAVAVAASVTGLLLAGRPAPKAHVQPVAPTTSTTLSPNALSSDVRRAAGDGPYGVAALYTSGPVLLDASRGGLTRVPGTSTTSGFSQALSAGGAYVADASGDDSAVLTVRERTGRVLWSGSAGAAANFAWSPVTDTLAVLAGDTLTLVDVRADRATPRAASVGGTPDTADGDLAWSPDGRSIAIGVSDGTVVVDAASRQVGPVIPLPSGSAAPLSWSSDSRHLAVIDARAPAVGAPPAVAYAVDVAARTVTALGGSGLALAWHPAGGSAVVGVLVDATDTPSPVRCDLATARCAAFARVGDAVTTTATGVAYLDADGGLVLAAADGSGARPAPGAPKAVIQVVASRDGRTLLLVAATQDTRPVVYRYADGRATPLATLDADVASSATIGDWVQP